MWGFIRILPKFYLIIPTLFTLTLGPILYPYSLNEESQIRVKFLSDPAMPICSRLIYPNEAWKSDNLVSVGHSKKHFHQHKISDFAPWMPRHIQEWMPWVPMRGGVADEEAWRVLVEERSTNMSGEQILWDIIPALNNRSSVELES